MSTKDYEQRVRDIGCIVCKHLKLGWSPASVHHVESVRDNLSAYAIVPLCYAHHQGPQGVHGLGRRGFVATYKLTEIDLIAIVNRELSK